jgi:hypothetical protein
MVFCFLLALLTGLFIGCPTDADTGSDNEVNNDTDNEVNDKGFIIGDKDTKTISGISFTMIYSRLRKKE